MFPAAGPSCEIAIEGVTAAMVNHDRVFYGRPIEILQAVGRWTGMSPALDRAPSGNAEAIASTPGVDLIWVGHFDLSTSLGVAGQFDHPRFRDATARIAAA